jgi:hypothetical protein
MLPHGHLALGYILYSVYSRIKYHETINSPTIIFIGVGTQLPDLIDKPLGLLGVLPSGRALGHSLLFAIPLAVVVGSVLHRWSGEWKLGVAFGLSYVSALLGDGALLLIHGTVTRDLIEISFWVWPFLFPADRIVEIVSNIPILALVVESKSVWAASVLPTGEALRPWIRSFELGLTSIAVILWLYDGQPGHELLGYVRDVISAGR